MLFRRKALILWVRKKDLPSKTIRAAPRYTLRERKGEGLKKRIPCVAGSWALGELKLASRGVGGVKHCSTISILFPFHMLPAQQE